MISLVANSGWYGANQYNTVTIPVPNNAQFGDLLVGIVAGAAAPPPNGADYSFYGSYGYSLQSSGSGLWFLTRFATSSNPGIELPPVGLDEENNPANNAVGIIYVFRGPREELGITATQITYDFGPSVNSNFPVLAGNDSYSITAISGNEFGSRSVSSNPYNLGLLADEVVYSPNLRVIVYGGNISSSNNSNSAVTLTINGSTESWNSGGIAFKNYDTLSVSVSLTQNNNSLVSTVTVVSPVIYFSVDVVQENNSVASTTTVTYPPIYLSLNQTQNSNTISSTLSAVFDTRYAYLDAVQQSNTLQSEAGFVAIADANLQQEGNYLASTIALQIAADLGKTQYDDIVSSFSTVEVSASFGESQNDNVLNAVINGALLLADIECGSDVLVSDATVDVTAAFSSAQNADMVAGNIRHFWFPPAEKSVLWNNKNEDNSIWVKVPKTEVF